MKRPGQERQWFRLVKAAEEEVQAVEQALPAPIRRLAKPLPVTFEPYPSKEMIEEGLAPDLLGLFVGDAINASLASEEALPAQILLFLESIWDYTHHDPETYREEVRRTYLHELGHYLGLDEDGLADRDLD